MEKYIIRIREAEVKDKEGKIVTPEILAIDYSAEKTIDADNYSIEITLGLRATDGVAPDFSKVIVVESKNSQTGYEVDTHRQTAIKNYMIDINK